MSQIKISSEVVSKPESFVSLCGQNVRKIGPTQFEMTATNFIPTADLSILILDRYPQVRDRYPQDDHNHESRDTIQRKHFDSFINNNQFLAENDPSFVASNQSITDANCDQHWYRRNSIFKVAGYCFKTARAIRAFGNAGCQYYDQRLLPLSDEQRIAVSQIRIIESQKQCR